MFDIVATPSPRIFSFMGDSHATNFLVFAQLATCLEIVFPRANQLRVVFPGVEPTVNNNVLLGRLNIVEVSPLAPLVSLMLFACCRQLFQAWRLPSSPTCPRGSSPAESPPSRRLGTPRLARVSQLGVENPGVRDPQTRIHAEKPFIIHEPSITGHYESFTIIFCPHSYWMLIPNNQLTTWFA